MRRKWRRGEIRNPGDAYGKGRCNAGDMAEFEGKTVLVTGGGSGIGLATARRLVESGAQVVLAGRSSERLEKAERDLGAPDRVLAVPADVSCVADIDTLYSRVRER